MTNTDTITPMTTADGSQALIERMKAVIASQDYGEVMISDMQRDYKTALLLGAMLGYSEGLRDAIQTNANDYHPISAISESVFGHSRR